MANELMTIPQLTEMTILLKESSLLNNDIRGNGGNIFLTLLMGQELGLSVTQAINSIYVVKGKPSISTQLMLSLIYKHMPKGEVIITENKDKDGKFLSYTCKMTRPDNGFTFTTNWDFNRASVAGLYPAKPDAAWSKYPETMCRWRAISECARIVFPDVIQGMYSREEAEDMDKEEPRQAKNEAKPSIPVKPLTPDEEQKVKDNVEEVINNPPDLSPERHALEIKFHDLWRQLASLSFKVDKGQTINGFKLSFGMKAMDDYKEFDDNKLISYSIELEEAILNLKPSK